MRQSVFRWAQKLIIPIDREMINIRTLIKLNINVFIKNNVDGVIYNYPTFRLPRTTNLGTICHRTIWKPIVQVSRDVSSFSVHQHCWISDDTEIGQQQITPNTFLSIHYVQTFWSDIVIIMSACFERSRPLVFMPLWAFMTSEHDSRIEFVEFLLA